MEICLVQSMTGMRHFPSGEKYLRKWFWERKQYEFYNEHLERLYKLKAKIYIH